jgi:excisionase family DNA binding protein
MKGDREGKTHGLARVEQACEFLAVSRATLYELMNAGRIRSVTLPGRGKGDRARRIEWQELHAFVAERRLAAETKQS